MKGFHLGEILVKYSLDKINKDHKLKMEMDKNIKPAF